MIPFNHLGWFFDLFGSAAYPDSIVQDLCDALEFIPADATVLDLGAGTGIVGNYARMCRDDLSFIAADPAKGMLRYVPQGIEKVTARAEKLPFDDDTFDAIVTGEALHHFQDPDLAMQEMVRVLRKGGLLFIYEFDPSSLPGRLLCWTERMLGEPGNFYAPSRLASMLKAHGFTLETRAHKWRYTLAARLQE